MRHLYTYRPFFVAAVIMCLLVAIVYPYCQYYIDPDATAYLTIAKRYAAGNFDKAINAYWSPWSCWLTALFIKAGFAANAWAIVVNSLGAIGFLFISQSFFLKYRVAIFTQWMLCISLAVFLVYAVYYQNFDDLWECFFLLAALRIMLLHRFKSLPVLWMLAGVVGALAYFAKAYAFPYFIISSLCILFYVTRAWYIKNLDSWLLISSFVIGTMLLCSFPWIYLLHDKYGVWMTATAGRLNMSWYLVGHPVWKDGIQYLLPPVYADSPSYWEDPWFVNGNTPHWWDSLQLFIRQILKIAQNTLKFTNSGLQISIVFIFIWAYIVRALFYKKMVKEQYRAYFPVIIPFLLFPLPFFLVNFEARYIWYMLPLSMLLGIAAIGKSARLNKKWVIVLFAVTYILWPVWGIMGMWNKGKADYELAQTLHKTGIKGSFASNVIFGMPEAVAMQRVAYFSGNPYYIMYKKPASFQEILPQLRRYGVRYYYHYKKYDMPMENEAGKPFPLVFEKEGLKVFLLNP